MALVAALEGAGAEPKCVWPVSADCGSNAATESPSDPDHLFHPDFISVIVAVGEAGVAPVGLAFA